MSSQTARDPECMRTGHLHQYQTIAARLPGEGSEARVKGLQPEKLDELVDWQLAFEFLEGESTETPFCKSLVIQTCQHLSTLIKQAYRNKRLIDIDKKTLKVDEALPVYASVEFF